MKNSIPEGPNPARCTPFTKKNNGITVIGPARVKIKDNFINLENQKHEPELFDQKIEPLEEEPLILTNEIKENKKAETKKLDQTLSPAVRKIVNENKIDINKIKGTNTVYMSKDALERPLNLKM